MQVKKIKNYSEIPKDYTGIVEYPDGRKEWYLNDKRHREDGPAIERSDGSREWWLNGICHREDGPAIEWANGDKWWCLNGNQYYEAEWKVAVERLKKEREEANKPRLQEIEVEYSNQVPKGFTGLVKHKNGNKFWLLNGKHHREDGPAVEFAGGDKQWWLNGKPHREDGPAIDRADGDKWWYLNGKLHREDGPACEYADGEKRWYLNGERHRVDGPAVEWVNGDKEWWLNGERHRVDGPAREYADGEKRWLLNGEYHRVDGPAIEFADGEKQWFLNGKRYSEAEWLAAKSVPQKTGEPALTETVASRTMEPSQPVVNKTTETNDKPANGEKNKMSTMENIKEIAVSDAKVVAYRVAASQIGKVMTNAVIKLLSGNMKGKQLAGFRKNMTEFFQTPLGEALLMFMIGCATPFFIKYVPEKYRAHALKVAEAARHEAEFIAASKLMDSFMPILSMAGSGMFSALEGLVSSSEEEESWDRIRIDAGNSSVSQLQEENVVSHASARRAVG